MKVLDLDYANLTKSGNSLGVIKTKKISTRPESQPGLDIFFFLLNVISGRRKSAVRGQNLENALSPNCE